MHDTRYHEPWRDRDLPDGAGTALAIAGALVTLPPIVAAVMMGKPLWMVMTIWALGSPAVTLALGLVALRGRDGEADPAKIQHGEICHV